MLRQSIVRGSYSLALPRAQQFRTSSAMMKSLTTASSMTRRSSSSLLSSQPISSTFTNVFNKSTATRVSRTFSSKAPPPNGVGGGGGIPGLPSFLGGPPAPPGEYLELYTTNLTQMAADGKLDPLVGRHEEIQRCLQILARRTKNSTLFVVVFCCAHDAWRKEMMRFMELGELL